MDEEHYVNVYLKRYTKLRIKEDDINDYLEECKNSDIEPEIFDFLDNYLDTYECFDTFDETVDDTDIINSDEFDKFIKNKNND